MNCALLTINYLNKVVYKKYIINYFYLLELKKNIST